MNTIIFTKNVNTIQVQANKGEQLELIVEKANSFIVNFLGKERMVSKKVAKLVKIEAVKTNKKGVIATVIEKLREGSKTKSMLLDILELEFPERDREAMAKTLNAQLGFGLKAARIETEQKITLKTERVSKDVIFFEIAL